MEKNIIDNSNSNWPIGKLLLDKPLGSLYFDSYGEFNPVQYLVDAFSTKRIQAVKVHCESLVDTCALLEEVKELGFKPLVTVRYTLYNATKHDYLIHESKSCIIDLSTIKPYESSDNWDSKIGVFYVDRYDDGPVKEGHQSNVDKLVEKLKKYEKPIKKEKKKSEISFMTQQHGSFSLIERELKPVALDLTNDYNLSFDLDKLQEALASAKSGLLLFTGVPGTGKSYLIKYLAQQSKKKFIFCPVSLVPLLSDPSFLNFAINEFKDAVLIIEDAETALTDRSLKNDSLVATLLNLTDGIFGDIIELKVICTINREDHIDKALQRKGRLLAKVDFRPLSAEQANKLHTRLGRAGKLIHDTATITLAEAYNWADNGSDDQVKQPIGFKQ